MPHDRPDLFSETLTRRTLLKRAGVGAVAVLGGSLYATAPAAARAQRVRKGDTPLGHVIISCQENRSFDHYFGYASQVQDAGFCPPAGYSQPAAAGNRRRALASTQRFRPDP